MNDELAKKIKQITDMLSQDNLPENVKSLLSMIATPTAADDSSQKSTDADSRPTENTKAGELEENIEMLRKIKKIMDKVNLTNDTRIALLSALYPFMGARRQKKIKSCINILRIASLAKILEEQEKDIF